MPTQAREKRKMTMMSSPTRTASQPPVSASRTVRARTSRTATTISKMMMSNNLLSWLPSPNSINITWPHLQQCVYMYVYQASSNHCAAIVSMQAFWKWRRPQSISQREFIEKRQRLVVEIIVFACWCAEAWWWLCSRRLGWLAEACRCNLSRCRGLRNSSRGEPICNREKWSWLIVFA